MTEWIADVVVINESPDEAEAGDVSIYRSAGEACRALEHWWVDTGKGFAFTASGDRLTLGVDDRSRVMVLRQDQMPDGRTLVREWLHASAKAVLEARRANAQKGKVVLNASEEQGRLPSSHEGLIAYIGFSD